MAEETKPADVSAALKAGAEFKPAPETTAPDTAEVPMPDLGDEVELHEHNFDPADGSKTDGYQAPKKVKVVKITEGSSTIDVKHEPEDAAAITSHDVPHKSEVSDGGNFWV